MPPLTPAAQERRKQILGLLIIAAVILIFTAWRAGWHAIIPPGWWR
jgi:hypothetical protein